MLCKIPPVSGATRQAFQVGLFLCSLLRFHRDPEHPHEKSAVNHATALERSFVYVQHLSASFSKIDISHVGVLTLPLLHPPANEVHA